MFNRIKFISLTFILLSLFVKQIAYGQTDRAMMARIKAKHQETSGWINQKWSLNDKPYLAAQNQVDVQLQNAKDKTKVVDTYVQQWKSKPKNPLSFFTYAYATYQTLPLESNQLSSSLNRLSQGFQSLPTQPSYHYSRLRFLVETRIFPHPDFKPLAKRLIQVKPTDKGVLYYSINLWDTTRPEERSMALKVVQTLLKLEPQRPSVQAAAGWVHYRIWLSTKSKEEAEKAKAYYVRYLEIAPQTDSFRPHAQRLVARINAKRWP